MSLNPNNTAKAPKNLPEEGLQVARCFAIIDLGTQPTSYKGVAGDPQPQVMLCFELTKFMKTFKPEEGPVPAVIMQKYAFSNGAKSKLPKILKSWGRVKGEIKTLDLQPYNGQLCVLNITHSENGEYANIGDNGRAVNPFSTDFAKPQPHYEKIWFDLDKFSWAEYNKLPQWPKKLITESAQWQDILKKYPAPVGQGVEQESGAQVPSGENTPSF